LRDELAAGDHVGQPAEGSEQEWVARFMREFDAEEVQGGEGGGDRANDAKPAVGDDRQPEDGREAAAVRSNEKGA
jgi:hypothetical protein